MLARLTFLSCQWCAQERLATDGTPWKLTRNGKGQFVTMGKRVNTQRSSVCRQMGMPHKRLAQVRAKLGEPPAELINQLKLDGSAAPEEWTHLPCRHEPAP